MSREKQLLAPNGAQFRWVKAPTSVELGALAHTMARRIGRLMQETETPVPLHLLGVSRKEVAALVEMPEAQHAFNNLIVALCNYFSSTQDTAA